MASVVASDGDRGGSRLFVTKIRGGFVGRW